MRLTRFLLLFVAMVCAGVSYGGIPPAVKVERLKVPPCCTVESGSVADQVVSPSVVVLADNSMGTGTAITFKGNVYVLTAAHVVADNMNPTLTFRVDGTGKTTVTIDKTPKPVTLASKNKTGKAVTNQSGKIIWYDAHNDLALILPNNPDSLTPAQPPDCYEPELGEDVYYCGSGGGLHWSLVKSIVNQYDDTYLTVNGAGWYGHSGSGVYMKRGGNWQLHGVLVAFAQWPKNNIRSPMVCVPLPTVYKFLEAMP